MKNIKNILRDNRGLFRTSSKVTLLLTVSFTPSLMV